MNILNLGCGKYPEKDKVNLDIVPLPGVDVVHDLDIFPYPFPGEYFDKIIARDVIEHVTDVIKVIDELYRIMKPGGTLWIRTNLAKYPDEAWTDPSHKHAFSMDSFDYWDDTTFFGREFGFYSKTKLKVLNKIENNKGIEVELQKI